MQQDKDINSKVTDAKKELEMFLNPVIAKILDSYNLVINKGSIDNIKEGDRFLVYEITEDIVDPVTKQSLGPLELSKGTGEVVYVFDRKAIIRSDRMRGVGLAIGASKDEIENEPEKYLLPFKKPKEGDIAKPVKS